MSVALQARAAVIVALSCLGFAPLGTAATIVNDDFSAMTHPSAFRTVPNTAGLGIPFYTRYAVNTGSNNARIVNEELVVESITNYPVIGLLPGTASLANTDDFIKASFSFRFLNDPADGNSNFRFGLHGSLGTPLTGDNQALSDDDQGYYFQIGDTAQTAGNLFYRESGGQGTITNGNDRSNGTASGPAPAITLNVNHTAEFLLTRTNSTTITASLSIDGATAFTAPFATLYTNFDEVSMGNGFAAPYLNYAIDNLVVEANNFTPVPEPAVLGMVASAAMLLGWWRRNR